MWADTAKWGLGREDIGGASAADPTAPGPSPSIPILRILFGPSPPPFCSPTILLPLQLVYRHGQLAGEATTQAGQCMPFCQHSWQWPFVTGADSGVSASRRELHKYM